jgi:DNA-binding GntR family transcriptional regulator
MASDETTPRLKTIMTSQHATLLWLRGQIAAGVYRPGEQLRQDNLAKEFGVSVPPVREALKTLEAEGQVVYSPNRGYFVAAMSVRELEEIYRIRTLLEAEAVTRATVRLGRADLVRMREAMADMRQAERTDDVPALTEANRRFHFTLYRAAEMPRMADIIRVLWESSDRYRSVYFATRERRRQVNREHRAIMSALTAHDAPLAIHLLDAHRQEALTALRSALAAEGESAAEVRSDSAEPVS